MALARFRIGETVPELGPLITGETVFVCVGSDRSTGDSFGPLVGTRLKELGFPNVYGTLESPVHARNLEEILDGVHRRHPGALIMAVDACLGRSENIGIIAVKEGPLRPGTGVGKVLPEVGDMHMVGVVNVGGFMEYFVLQNTRLHLVMQLVDMATRALVQWSTYVKIA